MSHQPPRTSAWYLTVTFHLRNKFQRQFNHVCIDWGASRKSGPTSRKVIRTFTSSWPDYCYSPYSRLSRQKTSCSARYTLYIDEWPCPPQPSHLHLRHPKRPAGLGRAAMTTLTLTQWWRECLSLQLNAVVQKIFTQKSSNIIFRYLVWVMYQ